jgi:hypothetical protein
MRREHDREELTPHDEDGNIDRKGTTYGSSVARERGAKAAIVIALPFI